MNITLTQKAELLTKLNELDSLYQEIFGTGLPASVYQAVVCGLWHIIGTTTLGYSQPPMNLYPEDGSQKST